MPTRADAIDAVTVLDRIVGEIATGVGALRWIQARRIENAQFVGLLENLCITQLVFAGCKFVEFYKHFQGVLADEERVRAKRLVDEIEDRGLVAFRNTLAGHIWDRQKNRIVMDSESRAMMDRITKGNPDSTLEWIMPASGESWDSAYGTVTALLNGLRERYSVRWEEARGR